MVFPNIGLLRTKDHWNLRGTFSVSVAALSAVFIPLFFVFVRYSNDIANYECVPELTQSCQPMVNAACPPSSAVPLLVLSVFRHMTM